MPGRRQTHLDPVAADGLAIGQRPHRPGVVLPEPGLHDRQGLVGGQDQLMARPGVVGMAMGDHGAGHGTHRINVEIPRRAIEAGGLGAKDGFRPDHVRVI